MSFIWRAPFCSIPLGRNLVGFCRQDSTCFRLRWRKISTWIFRPSCFGLCLPFICSQFLLFSRASYFLFSISSSLTRLGPWGWRKCSHPDVSFIQAENGRETWKDRRCIGSWLYSHTLLFLKSCTTGTCVKTSLTLHSLYTGTLSDTLGQERASVCTSLGTHVWTISL